MINRLALFSLMLLLVACAARQADPVSAQAISIPTAGSLDVAAGELYSVHLYRHAEKQTGSDPELTGFGLARAQFLAEQLAQPNMAIRQVWSSPYRRTMQTAQPLAHRLGLEIRTYDPRQQEDLVTALRESTSDAAVFGHSNTIPELASLLCQCEVEAMPESEYERGYVVVLGHGVRDLYEVDMTRSWTDRPTQAD